MTHPDTLIPRAVGTQFDLELCALLGKEDQS